MARASMRDPPVFLTPDQRLLIEAIAPEICRRGGWDLIECGAQEDHVHFILDIDPEIHGKRVRPILKRWLSQALNERWPQQSRRVGGFTWWAEGGSTRAVHGREYRFVAPQYVARQKATQPKRDPPRDPF
jgi:REP element-mobilizing transposase RayT